VVILDHLANPYRFESFLNVAQEDQARLCWIAGIFALAALTRARLATLGPGDQLRLRCVVFPSSTDARLVCERNAFAVRVPRWECATMPLDDKEQEELNRRIRYQEESRRLGRLDGLAGVPINRLLAPDLHVYDQEYWTYYKPSIDLENKKPWEI
jgi:hypothetical protein